MSKTNNERLQEVAEGMQDLNERLVYVGGAMVGVYATTPGAPICRWIYNGEKVDVMSIYAP